jgi:hypothetical protein
MRIEECRQMQMTCFRFWYYTDASRPHVGFRRALVRIRSFKGNGGAVDA